MLGIARNRLLSCSRNKHINKTLKRSSIVFCNYTIGAVVILVGTKGPFGHDHSRLVLLLITTKQTKL